MPARKPPARVWVYWCKRCGLPILADKRKDCDVDCPYCPYPQDKNVAVERYVREEASDGR